jgi:hypothetical protein
MVLRDLVRRLSEKRRTNPATATASTAAAIPPVAAAWDEADDAPSKEYT